MRSLNAHLTAAAAHGHLPFHPDCPVCRADRLAGPLADQPIVSQRAQASLVAGVLALSTAGPAATVAVADTPAGEGTSAPGTGDGTGQQGPGFDPGGEIPLPNQVPPPPPAVGGDDDSPGGPVEGEPQEPVRAPAATGTPSGAPATPTSPTTGTPTGAAPAVTPPAGTTPTPAPRVEPDPPRTEPRRKAQRRHPKADRSVTNPRQTAPAAAAGPQAPPVAPTQATAAASAGDAPAASTSEIPDAARTYDVRAGDSLWSIARRLLGPDATPAQIAREVHRLWGLNADRIGTGNPNLIMVGQTLRLR